MGVSGHFVPHGRIIQQGKNLYFMYFMLAVAYPVDFIESENH